jgi:hypothetical protein
MFALNYLFFAATTTAVDYTCVYGGVCKETSGLLANFNEAIEILINYFFNDPNNIYQYIFGSCQVIAGIGALWFLTPLMLDSVKESYGINLNKLFLLFVLLLMFAGEGRLGKSLAYGNYAFIQGIHQNIHELLTNPSSPTILDTITNEYSADQQKVLQITNQMLICRQIEEKKTDPTTLTKIDNPVFTDCFRNLKDLIKNYTLTDPFTNLSTRAAFSKAASKTTFIDMATAVRIAASGFINLTDNDVNPNGNNDIGDLLVGWRAAIAIVPDLALVGALLFYPFPLALSFISTSYLQSWFAGMWTVGLFKFMMTIFNSTFIVIQAKLAGEMPQNTIDLVLGIVAPTIAISLATNSGLGLSNLVSQGVSNLSAKLTGTSSTTSDAATIATTPSKTK